MKKLWRKGLDITVQLLSCPKQTHLVGEKYFAYSAVSLWDTIHSEIILLCRLVLAYWLFSIKAESIWLFIPLDRDVSFHQWWNWDQVTYLRHYKETDTGSKRKGMSCFPDLSIYMHRPQRQTESTSWLAHGLQGDVRRLMLREQIRMCSRFTFLSVQPLNLVSGMVPPITVIEMTTQFLCG